MKFSKVCIPVTISALSASHAVMAVEADVYGSLRVGVEAVDPDNAAGNFGSYGALRDAYSRVGMKLSHSFNDDWLALLQVELPLDLANVDLHSPNDEGDTVRIAKVQLSGPFGTAWYGRGWLAYYNYIAYPLDYFSSYYSGWATLTTFRREQTFYYATPTWSGLQLAFASTDDNGTASDRRNQYVASYSNNGLTLAAGRDDLGDGGYAINGISATYSTGPWYLAAKYEQLDGGTNDGESATNLLVQYAIDGKNTVRGMIADVEAWGYGDKVLHLGWDHQYRDDLKFFVEYYQEESTAAISDRRKSTYSTGDASFAAPADSGGRVLTVGLRYDF